MTSVRLLPEKYCAFINFKTKESAGRAMHGLQVKLQDSLVSYHIISKCYQIVGDFKIGWKLHIFPLFPSSSKLQCSGAYFWQGMECAGQRLLIKFPDNPINNGSVVLRKGPGGLGGPGGPGGPSHTKRWVWKVRELAYCVVGVGVIGVARPAVRSWITAVAAWLTAARSKFHGLHMA